ncbi:fungal-specific transcription factor domain-containing protein [Xylogone sp. PMI_703]|nr:fungal-specific transcription factor domain-containing protein [Xylogone sp. PMI_703]
MPRPKKEGGPEPKKRSRNGCWPCKTRKVKCDEGKPSCLNCQRLSEKCDYSIRLNWEGRGKKKPESDGQVDFSTGLITLGPNQEHVSDSLETTNNYENGFHASIWKPQSVSQQLGNYPQPVTSSTHSASNSLVVDPTLARQTLPPTPISQESLYGDSPGQSDYHYSQGYERYRSATPNTPRTVLSSGLLRLREAVGQDGQGIESESSVGSANSGTPLSRGTILPPITDTRASTPSFYHNIRDEDIAGPELPPIDRPLKRLRSEPENIPAFNMVMLPPNLTSAPYSGMEPQGSGISISGPPSSVGPLTPASSHGDDGYRSYPAKASPYSIQEPPSLRRLSVSSLLSGPPGMPYEDVPHAPGSGHGDVRSWPPNPTEYYQNTTTWGVDRGFKDLDIGKNDDTNAISGASPTALRAHLDLILDEDGEFSPVEFGFGVQTTNTTTMFEGGGYYDKPVPISIPRALEPLPAKLLENPMNLLHHFLNHTAGCLVPHNCLSNPFKIILPQMAVQDENLLNLLLAYSAFHRARLLRQPEPATRIALWVKDIFPNLRHALNDPNKIISNSNIATAIMLASLEIISPKAFGIAVPWQLHLDTARQMIAARGGPQTLQSSHGDKVSSFLWSWFAYLDVLACLSGDRSRSSLSAWVLDYEIDHENDYSIDCILGFTSRCINILAKIAELCRMCDIERIKQDHEIDPDWKPSEETITRAEKLEADLNASRLHPARPCPHMQSTGEAAYHWDSLEMAATNEAFHWAGLVHLHRRVLGKPSTHNDVQTAVREIFGALYKVRKGSSAEAGLLFPMFTAGCDTLDEKQRSDILDRLKGVETLGMTQVHAARTLMEKVFETGKPWETLVAGEFVG